MHRGLYDDNQCQSVALRHIFETRRKLAYSAGTKHPHMARIVKSATCRRYVLFPMYVSGAPRRT